MSKNESLQRKLARKAKRREVSEKIAGKSTTNRGKEKVIYEKEWKKSEGHTRGSSGTRRGWHFDYSK